MFLTVVLCGRCPLTTGFSLGTLPALSVLTAVPFLIFSFYFPAKLVAWTAVTLQAIIERF